MTEAPSLVLQDMNFSRHTSGEEGLALLRELKGRWPHVPVVLMTAWGSIPLAVEGMKAGAADFVTKPWTNAQLLQSVRTALGLAEARPSATGPHRAARSSTSGATSGSWWGEDPRLLAALDVVARTAATDAFVLIMGESGTGKELVAARSTANSGRAGRPFVPVNCGAHPDELLESELFGHVKGAFTGRDTRPQGALRAGRHRNDLPRRDRGPEPGHAGQAAAGAAGQQLRGLARAPPER